MAHLLIKTGEKAGTRVELKKVTCIGRGSDMDVRLDDLTVSKRHARIIRNEQGEHILEDLASSNGTFLNGLQVTTKKLASGDQVRIGSTLFVFHQEDEDGRSAADRTLLDFTGDSGSSSVLSSVDVDAPTAEALTAEQIDYEQLTRANYQLRTVLEISQSIGSALDEDELLNKILDALFEVFPETNRGFIILRDPETGQLTPAASRLAQPSGGEERLQVSATILDYVLEQKRALLIAGPGSADQLPTSQSMMDLELQSVMCAPLKCEDQVLGFIQLDTPRMAAHYDEDGLRLLAGIANQAALTIANARLHRQLVRREALERDLRAARLVQNSFLPQEPPKVPGYEFVDWYGTALEVGGDFYDFIEMPDGRILVVVGDVSGKGITAALMMAQMASHVRFFAGTLSSPSQMLVRLNEAALRSGTDMFVTVLIMCLDPGAHSLVVANAGHCYPLLRHSDGTVERVEGGNGFPVGLTRDAEFPEQGVSLGPGDSICAFTDGIVEAMNEQNELFGYRRLTQSLEGDASSPGEIVRTIQRALREHAGAAPQSDDLTLVCFGRLPEGGR